MIWDWNGTLLDDVDACITAMNTMLARRTLPLIDADSYRGVFEFPVRNYYHAIGFDLEHEDWDDLCVEYHDLYAVHSVTSQLRTGTLDSLTRLRDAGVSMHLLSASEAGILRRMVERRAILPFFTGIAGLDNLHAQSKEVVGTALLERHRISRSEAVLVGDTTHDMEVAERLGCPCLILPDGHQSEARLRERGASILPDMRSVAAHVMAART